MDHDAMSGSGVDTSSPKAKHGLILVIGGDMRDLREVEDTHPWARPQADSSQGKQGCWLQPRFQRMRPVGPVPINIEPAKDASDREGRNLEVLALVDRFDTEPGNRGIHIQRISRVNGALEITAERRDTKTENPVELLPHALKELRAEHIAIVFWGHGSGIFGGLLGDAHPDEYGKPWLPLDEAAAWLREAGLGDKKKVDLIAVVGCFSGMIETLHAFEPYARTFAGFANKVDPSFFDFGRFIDAIGRGCTEGKDESEHWAKAAVLAIETGFEAYSKAADGGYRFARCAASAWRTEMIREALVKQEAVLKVVRRSWPLVLERAVQEAHYYDDMDTADLHHFVGRLGALGTDPILQQACAEFSKDLHGALIAKVVKGYAAPQSLMGLGAWLPRRRGRAFEMVAAAYERLGREIETGDTVPAAKEDWLRLQKERLGFVGKPDRPDPIFYLQLVKEIEKRPEDVRRSLLAAFSIEMVDESARGVDRQADVLFDTPSGKYRLSRAEH